MFAFRVDRIRAILAVFVLTGLTACNFPSGTPENTPIPPDAIFTEAAQTLIARLTQTPPPVTSIPAGSVPTPAGTSIPTGISPPTFTASPASPSPTAALTPNPTATNSPTDPKLSLGDPTWKDTFADSKSWSLSDDDHTKMAVEDGNLVMTAKKAENWDGWTITYIKGKNFYLEMTATTGDCNGLDHYGVVFRTNDDASEAYLFGLSCDGRYSFYLWDGEGFNRLIKWTANSAINSGSNQTNRLGVQASSDKFSFYANGVLLDEYQDASYTEGHIGVYIGSANTADFTVKVKELDFWELK